MSYQKQNFVSGQKLMASALNHIENGIVAVEETAGVTSVNGQTGDVVIGIPTVITKLSEMQDDSAHRTVADEQIKEWDEKLNASELGGAIDDALAQAKESGEFNGEDGYTPIKGVDYYTPTDKAEIEAYIATELAKRGQLEPACPEGETVDECLAWLAENGDKSKLYVLPDGFIYAWMLTEK